MTFFEYIEGIEIAGPTALTIGNFDGVHIGHRKLIDETVRLAKENNLESIAFTYANHPQNHIYGKKIDYITADWTKEKIILSMGIDKVLNVPFDDTIKTMHGIDFFKNILINKLKVKYLIIGADASFGKSKDCTAEDIKNLGVEYGVHVYVIPLVIVDNLRVSSTVIRSLIKDGDIITANRYLCRRFMLEGTVVHGYALGRQLGFPTANIEVPTNTIVPANGVYKTWIEIDGEKYSAMTNIGTRPTFEGERKSVESHIINWKGDLYNKYIQIYFDKKIREERKFSSKEDLINQLEKDRELVKEINNELLLY